MTKCFDLVAASLVSKRIGNAIDRGTACAREISNDRWLVLETRRLHVLAAALPTLARAHPHRAPEAQRGGERRKRSPFNQGRSTRRGAPAQSRVGASVPGRTATSARALGRRSAKIRRQWWMGNLGDTTTNKQTRQARDAHRVRKEASDVWPDAGEFLTHSTPLASHCLQCRKSNRP